MFKRMLLVVLLGISLTLPLATEAPGALVCPAGTRKGCPKTVAGVTVYTCCVKTTGSVQCYIYASGLGNCIDNLRFLGCKVEGTGEYAVACGNPGTKSWEAPGIQIVYFPGGEISGEYLIRPEDCDDNGNAYVKVIARPSQDLLAALENAGACRNEGSSGKEQWKAKDAVPCTMNAWDMETDEYGCIISEAVWYCELDACADLKWDKRAQKFEEKVYTCSRTDTIRHNPPLCPAAWEVNCTDTIDNDYDGRVDCSDPDCAGDDACPSTP